MIGDLPEFLVFKALDRLDFFIREHALVFMVGIIYLAFFGGIWLLLHLRRLRKSAGLRQPRHCTVIYFVFPAPPPPPHREAPARMFEYRPERWDDLRN
jgi:hypothetical protein